MRPHGHHSHFFFFLFCQSRTHCTWKHLKSHYLPFLPPPYCTKVKKGREAHRINCPTLEWPSWAHLGFSAALDEQLSLKWEGTRSGETAELYNAETPAQGNCFKQHQLSRVNSAAPPLVPSALCYRPTAENLISSGHEEWKGVWFVILAGHRLLITQRHSVLRLPTLYLTPWMKPGAQPQKFGLPEIF